MSPMFGLDDNQAVKEVRTVARVVDRWQEHFKSQHVSPHDIELYGQQIDRPFLKDQRSAYR
jgi:serine/threonine-protein kinase HipA